MDRDSFIITVYCLVVEHYHLVKEKYRLRRGGFAPALTDEEVSTMEICGAYSILYEPFVRAKNEGGAGHEQE